MAKPTTTVVIKAKNETQGGLNEAKSSFSQFTDSLNQLTGGKFTQLTQVLTNPFTLATTAIVATGKALVDLTKIGFEATEGWERFSASFGSSARALDGILDQIDQSTLATKEQLESMALALSNYNLPVEDLQQVLQTTADLATKTGKDFNMVQSAIISALNGQDRALTKLVPEWADYKEGAESSAEAVKNLGTKIHESAIQLQSGSVAQTLDNMSSSWTNIKDDLGEVIVMNIKGTGILDTICNWLSVIAEKTGARADLVHAAEYVQTSYGNMDLRELQKELLKDYDPDQLGELAKMVQGNALADVILPLLSYDELTGELVGYSRMGRQLWTGNKLQAEADARFVDNEESIRAGQVFRNGLASGTTTVDPYDILTPEEEASADEIWNNIFKMVRGEQEEQYEALQPIYESFGELQEVADTYEEEFEAWCREVGLSDEYVENVLGVIEGQQLEQWEAYQSIEAEKLEYEREQVALAKQEQEARQKQFEEIIAGVHAGINAVSSIYNTLADGEYQAGEIGSIISTIGSILPAEWGAILGVAGTGVSFAERIINDMWGTVDDIASSDTARGGMVASYNGATTVHINNYFDGANIVGSGGMSELAKILQDEFENLGYVNR